MGFGQSFLMFLFFWPTSVGLVLDQIPGLALQFAAESFQRGESQGIDLVVLDAREIRRGDADFLGEVVEGNVAFHHQPVEVHVDHTRPST